uniref:Uncharacterized protein n=1 Tax=Rhizophora mucronata TaxID=61149 RepID=A0A2P2P6W8_RHIMU
MLLMKSCIGKRFGAHVLLQGKKLSNKWHSSH